LEEKIPVDDKYEVYGFNWNIESELRSSKILNILDQLYLLGQPGENKANGRTDGSSSQNTSIEMNSLKTSLRSSGTYSSIEIEKMLQNEKSLLNLFINI